MRIQFFICCFIGWTTAFAAPYFEFNPQARSAYEKVISLRFNEAQNELEQLKINEPENYIVFYIENYIDFFSIFISENKETFDRLESNKNYRINKLKKADKSSPYYLYTQAEINLQWALARLKFEEYFSAFGEVRSAYKMLNKNVDKFPNFVANNKSLGILHALIGTVPDNYKWGVKLLSGMEGSIAEGQGEIEYILDYARDNDFIFEAETQVMYAFLLLHLNNQSEEAWSVIRSGALDPASNPLACFVLANVALRTGRSDEAVTILEQRPKSPKFYPFHYLEYMLGLAKLYQLDHSADVHFKRYLNNFNGINYIKEAYQKLAWIAVLKEDEAKYRSNMTLCINRGNAIIGGDKNAQKEASQQLIPDGHLLRARLLFDGGYYERAYNYLMTKSVSDFNQKRFQLEYTYRLGRITHLLNREKEAIKFYQKTINNGRNESYYFSCNAALQMGKLYEKRKEYDKAKQYFSDCQKINPDEYKSGLHQQAKAGLNRLKKIRSKK